MLGTRFKLLVSLTWPVDSWQERNSGVHGSLPSLEVRERLSFTLPVDNDLRASTPAKGAP